MDISGLFWIFLIIILLQPVIRQKLLVYTRGKLISSIEAERGSRLILLVHRMETLGVLGFPFFRYIDISDAEQVIRAIRMTGTDVPIDLVLHTPGGLVLPSLQIARAIARHEGKVTVIVPHFAMSGGTLIALAADEILMSEHAVLGPVDPQIGQFPAASLLRAVARKPAKEVDDATLIMADQAEMAIRQLRGAVKEITCQRMAAEQCDDLAEALTEGRWTHDYSITAEQARQMGLNVSTAMPERFLELMTLYPQPIRRQPTVEFTPSPRRKAPPGGQPEEG